MTYTQLLSELTIVVPTYNRQQLLLRLMQYWSGKNVRLLIIDGSSSSIPDSKLNEFESNVEYIYNPVGLYERLRNAATMVTTEFVMMGTDDDFFVPSALVECIQELKSDASLTSCGGLAVGFGYEDDIFLKKIYSNLKNLELLQEGSCNRTMEHFANYVPAHLYSVQRTKNWATLADGIFSEEFDFFAAWELQFEFLVPYLGPTKIINTLLWFRGLEVEPIRGTSASMSYDNHIFDWWNDPNFKVQKEKFFDHMEYIFVNTYNEKTVKFRDDLHNSFELYIDRNKKYERGIKPLLKKTLPESALLFLKKIRSVIDKLDLFDQRYSANLPVAFSELSSDGMKFSVCEIETLIAHIKTFHLQKNILKNS